ncbi:response regulator [Longimicrobium sp.]|uniref:response regulator n=1 Tax=Longimicrobium sp. TaxID=2029185 RepID=UPI002E2ECB17|nr:response regulator [Longimicrobium sp.]HEX6039355.1 response regulator [Longimicrobium sp.]
MTSRPLNLLLVDDDAVDVMNVRRALKANGVVHPLHVAQGAQEALEMLRGGAVSRYRRLVLLDLNLPRMNGVEFLRVLRGDPELCCTAVVVLTTSDDERDRLDAYNLNVAGYILKPVSFQAFCDTVSTLIQYWSLVELP